MVRPVLPLLAFAAALAVVGPTRAQTADEASEAALAAACVPPPCDVRNVFPPCDRAEVQHHLNGVEITSITVADGSEVRPLGGAAPVFPELSVCARRDDDSFLLYIPSMSEPLLRLGILQVLNAAMQSRAPVDLDYGLPNGALRKIEGVSFGAPVGDKSVHIKCGYGDFDRCDTGYEAQAKGEKARDTARITRANLIGYGKGSRAVQIFTDSKVRPSFILDPAAAPERYLQLMNLAFTAQIAGLTVEIVSVPGQPPAEAIDKSPTPPIALEITLAAMR